LEIGWIAVVSAFVYIGALFLVASYGDRLALRRGNRARPAIYALALSVYCTSWTFFGSVGLASVSGLDFLPIYIGPILMFTVGYPLIVHVARLSKAERITSVSDFLSSRYGKSQSVAIVATLITVVGTVPYIALQLKAISASVVTLLPGISPGTAFDLDVESFPILGDIALLIAVALALFAVLFGTRHTDATEHQEGMMLAVAVEAVIKLAAFLIVGVYVTYFLFEGPGDLLDQAARNEEIVATFSRDLSGGRWLAMTSLAFAAALLLPRQFHITVVENNSPAEIKRAALLFPAYLIAINLFVIPIAVAGVLTFGSGNDGDLFVLELPHAAGSHVITLIAFLGGLSAATAMVIVASVALAIMISNEIIVPLFVRQRGEARQPADMGVIILNVRRASIAAVLLLAYLYYRIAASGALASIGLLSFAAIAQLAPAFFGGLIWRRASARGAIAGMISGFLVWIYTLLLPTFADAGLVSGEFLAEGPFGISLLRPQALFNFALDPLAHGMFWSFAANIIALVTFSLSRPPQLIERLQANIFTPAERVVTPAFRPFQTDVTVGELKTTIARYLGQERTDRSFDRLMRETDRRIDLKAPVDLHLLKFAEQLLASAIGAASSRLVLSLLVNRDDPSTRAAHSLLDDATEAIQYNRDLLQTVLDQMDQGIAVLNQDLHLVCWNRPFRTMLDLPQTYGQVGASLQDIVRHLAEHGIFGEGDREALAIEQIEAIVGRQDAFQSRHPGTGRILRMEPSRVNDNSLAITITDVTEQVESEAELSQSKLMLERRVAQRTEELVRVNQALEKATAAAEEANIGKTRFIAAAGHDILQPLNAARLYASAISERAENKGQAELSRDLETALDSVEDIFKVVLELSQLDSGQLKPEIQVFRIQGILDRVRVEFEPQARQKGLELIIVPCSLSVRSDPHLLGRLVQNLVSNAIKYTASGRVLVGCRRKSGKLLFSVFDTGIGIAVADRDRAFNEFQRLESGVRAAPGLGLGLSIVQRIARVLGGQIRMESRIDRGTSFTFDVPLAVGLPATAGGRPAPEPARAAMAGLTALCIDNDAKILAGMQALLGGWGCEVITASSGREALRLLRKDGEIPDVLLVDYHLDEGNGLSAITDIRWKYGPDLPAVLITADRSQDVRDAATNSGVRVLHKPLKPAALRALVSQLSVQRPAAE
jgi:Na+/proline symporter/CheY-like chemotaxis protein